MGHLGKIIGGLAVAAIIFSILAYFIIGWLFETLGGFAWLLLFGLLLLTIAGVIFIGPWIISAIGLGTELAGTVNTLNAAQGILNRSATSPGTPAATPTPTVAPSAPPTPTDYKQLATRFGLAFGIGATLYFLFTYFGLTSLPAIATAVITSLLVVGAFNGNAVCQLALYVTIGLVAEVIVIIIGSGSALLTGLGIFFIWIIALFVPLGGRRTKIVSLFLFIITITFLLLVFNTNILKGYVSSGSQIQKSIDALGKSFGGTWNAFWTNLPGLFKAGQLEVQRQINVATGDYETGVEAQSTKQLGVFLENLGLTETRVRKDGTVDFYARLRAESFTTSANAEPLLVTLRCTDDMNNKMGSIRPQDTFTIEEYESLDVDCLFNARDLNVGSNTLSLEATFDFTTSAFLKSYFMDQETIRSYTRQGEDPLDSFQITDKNPVAVYTAGPMRIGMSAGKQPISLVASTEEGPTLTLTIERAWLDGELLSLDELSITVPPGLQIDSISGEPVGSACTSSTTQEQVCTFGTDFISKIITDLTKPFTTIKVFTKKRDPTKLLGGAPLAIRSFKTDIRYQYRIKKTQTVTITEGT